MKHYKVQLKIKSPVFIGSGNKLGKTRYVHLAQEEKIYVLHIGKLFKLLQKYDIIENYEALLLEGGNGKYKNNLYALLKEYGIGDDEIKSCSEYCYSANDCSFEQRSSSDIDEFYRDSYHLPYIPGSSLKGAIRTALVNYEAKNDTKRFDLDDLFDIMDEYGRKKDKMKKEIGKTATDFETEIFQTSPKYGRKKINADCFCGLRISDSKPLEQEDIILCQKIDVLPSKEASSLNLYRECLRPGTVVEFDLTIDERFFKYSIDDIMDAINFMYKNYCDNFLSRFGKDYLQEKNLIFLGGGAGYATKTMTYSMFSKADAISFTAEYLMETTPKNHNHDMDENDYCISPHMRKRTIYKGNDSDFGLCQISYKEIK